MNAKKILAIILSLSMVLCMIPYAFATEEEDKHEWDHNCLTTCAHDADAEDDANPIIIVPGIMQSQTYVTAGEDYEGNVYEAEYEGETVRYIMTSEKTEANGNKGFPVVEGMDMSFMFDTNSILENLKSKLGDIVKAMLTFGNDDLFDIVVDILDDACKDHYFNDDGTRINGVSVDEYWYSLEVAKTKVDRANGFAKGYKEDDDGNTLPTVNYPYQIDFLKRQVDMSSYGDKYGYDHIYYFAYPSFGNIMESAADLPEFIRMVKTQTGHDKVDICFISLGGTLANVYMANYYNADDVDRIILAACAIDGSYLLSDLMDANTTLDDTSVIYNELIPNIVELAAEEYMSLAYMGNTIARILPEELFKDFLKTALERGINECLAKMIRNCQSMWALVPSDVYPELSAKYISDESHALLKAETDKYYEIQCNAKNRIQELTAQGAEIFVISGYDLELPALVDHYRESSDNIIQASSTSVGGTFAKAGEKLDTSKIENFDEKYLSPDGNAYIGTCAVPERTFMVRGQSHLDLQSSLDDVIELCIQIATDKNLKNATTDNAGYAQFNQYRDLSEIKYLIKKYEAADESERAGATDYYEQAVEMVASRVWNTEETEELEAKFATAMDKTGITDEKSFTNYKLAPFFEKFFKFFSDLYAKIFKGKDFYLIPWFTLK